MTFELPWVFLALPLVVVVAAASFRRALRKVQPLRGATSLWAGPSGLGRKKKVSSPRLQGACLVLGSLLVVVALARPQWGSEEEITFDQAREVVLALDLSQSMLADDVSPTRLERSKLLVTSLLDELQGERVGLVVFSGTAFLQSPLSSDYEVLRDLLPELDPSYLPQGGTDYEAMLSTAMRSFHDADGKGDRFLIVLSDGEAHRGAYEALLPVLKARGIRVLGLGVGTPGGAMVPDGKGGWVKDERGAVVLSRLKSTTLEQLADVTGGVYRDAATWVDLQQLIETTVARGTEGAFVESSDLRLQDRFQWALAPGILLLLLAFWRELPAQPSARVIRSGRATTPREFRGAVIPLLSLLLLVVAAPGSVRAVGANEHHAEPAALEGLVVELVARSDLEAPDYMALAEATLAFASSQPELSASVRNGVIDDALSGVDRGEAQDPEAVDWAQLRARLEALREPPEPPSSPKSEQQDASEEAGQEGQDSGSPGESGQESGSSQSNASESGGSGDDASASGENAEQDARENSAEGSSGSETTGSEEPTEGSDGESHASDQAGANPEPSKKGSEERLASEKMEDSPGGEDEASGEEMLDVRKREDAGFGDLSDTSQSDAKEEGDEESAEDQALGAEDGGEAGVARPPARQVGGGTGRAERSSGPPELAAAVARMEKIREQDSPGVLFQRMNALEDPGSRPDRQRGKNW